MLPAGSPHAVVFLGLFVALGVVARYSARWQARLLDAADGPPVPGGKLLRLLPYATVPIAAIVPLAAGLYLVTTTTWTIVERAALRGTPAAALR